MRGRKGRRRGGVELLQHEAVEFIAALECLDLLLLTFTFPFQAL